MSTITRDILIRKCDELGVKYSSKERITSIKKKLENLGVDLQSLAPQEAATNPPLDVIVKAVLQQIQENGESSGSNKLTSQKNRKRKHVDTGDGDDETESSLSGFSDGESISSDEEIIEKSKSQRIIKDSRRKMLVRIMYLLS